MREHDPDTYEAYQDVNWKDEKDAIIDAHMWQRTQEESIQNQVNKYKQLLREDHRPELLKNQVAKLSISEKVNFYREKLASFRDR